MDEFINKEVKINITKDIYYRGIVLDIKNDMLSMRDINDELVYININKIMVIKEVRR